MKILSAKKEHAASTAEPILDIVQTFYTRAEVGWAHLIPIVDVKRMLMRVQQQAGMSDVCLFQATLREEGFLQ